jgi:hypothetical protein
MGGQRGVERGFGGVHVGADVLTIALVSTVVVPSGGVDAANSSRSRVISAECNARLAFSTCCRRFFGRVGHRAVRIVVGGGCRVRVDSNRLICRIANTSPLRGPSVSRVTSVSASRQVWMRRCSSVWLCSAKAWSSMSAVAPLRQVRMSNPAASRS